MTKSYRNTLFLLCFFTLQLSAQISFEASADAKQVLESDYFGLSFILKNANGSNFIAPNLNDFIILSGPNKTMRSTTINNKRTQTVSINYQLQPKRLGRLTIGVAKIQVNGKQLSTRPISIQSIKGQANKGDGTEKVFIKAKITHQTAYLGQQLVLDYVLFYNTNLQGVKALEESGYKGFYSREVHEYDKKNTIEIVNGKQYNSQIIKRVVLYPQQTGALVIDPISIIAEALKKGERPSFFSRSKVRRIPVKSEEITIQVNSLPTPKPDNFSDITGNYQMHLRINNKEITTDDALSVVLSFIGEGDLKRIQAPDLQFPPSFEVYEPKVITEKYEDRTQKISGTKVFEYLLIPNKSGQFTFQPSLVVFNPDSAIYQTLRARPFTVDVKQGKGDKQAGLVIEADNNSALFPPKKEMTIHSQTTTFLGTPVFWALFLTPLLAGIGLWFYQVKQDNKPAIDPVLLQQQRARQEALKRLDTARQYKESGNSKAFFNEVEDALLGYIIDKLQMPRADLTKTNVQSKLQKLGASEGQTKQFEKLIQHCEIALYSGMDNAEAMNETYEETLTLLSAMEAVLANTL